MIKKSLLSLVLILSANSINAQFGIGEIAFSAYSADPSTGDLDEFTIVLIRGAAIGEQVAFTDNGWLSTGGFRPGEDFFTLTFTQNYVPGSQIVCSRIPFRCKDINLSDAGTVSGSPLDLSFLGDQIFAYDPASLPTLGDQSSFIAAIQMNGGWDGTAFDDSSSAKPSAFTDGSTSISISPEVDNARINLPNCFGFTNQPSLLALCNNSSNWGDTSNAVGYNALPPVCDFTTVLSDGQPESISNNVRIFPNPANGLLNVNFPQGIESGNLTIYDITGQRVIESVLTEADNTIEVSALSQGVYLLKLETDSKSIIKKFIKE
ncbi:MAG: T9SS type A sorting domain-containing protein [Bacteroidia bacterium]|nr:T9SS type A sorting domain-containing protein [Bacteroidia bacterium]MBT8269398.1 T9SS type A sorting domain-containing protein [Bacteroidia bacterium]NNF82014.1 T9SS type A sorting domain-containing protein [Flavobacteriaceae bacterium]NNL80711.1 T9SS type A sorting domain-containing protein [Flavobacteriaceae bacterium]